ncbi:MAG TPA: carboxypeptidase-like regulatory domain-containing protein [Gemmatimonadaceae bacterium]|nr:carboxypeptidase-like regulatory domain-containing protein [Gemmatimonadaceae bacterium]
MERVALFFAAIGVSALPITAHPQQSTGGSIVGVVRDTDGRPLPAANVSLHPGDRRTQTDSSGQFALTGLGDNTYTVRARKLGFRPDGWDVRLDKGGRVEVKFALEAAPPLLDTVKVAASQPCPTQSIRAFLCRRQRGGGVFLDYTDIDDKEKNFVGELFYDVPDMLVDFKISASGPNYFIRSKRSGCISSIVDGRPASMAYPIPANTSRLVALEIYTRPDSVPHELREYLWPRSGDRARTGRCTVIVYWTNRGALEVTR